VNKQSDKWNLAFRASNVLIGALLGLALIYVIQNEVNWSVLLGALTAALILAGINVIKVRMTRGSFPNSNEGTDKHVLKFCFISSHILLGVLFIALSILNFLGVEEVSTSILWCVMIGYVLINGIVIIVISRK